MISLEEIKREIEIEKEKITQPYEVDDGLDVCREFCKNNNVSKLEQLLEVDIWEYIKCLSYIRCDKKKSIKECEEFSESFKKLFGTVSYHELKKLLDLLCLVADNNDEHIIIAGIGEDQEKVTEDFKKVVDFIKANPKEMAKVLAFLKIYKRLEFDMDSIKRLIKEHNLSGSLRKKAIRKLLSENYSEEDILYRFRIVNRYVVEEERKERDYYRLNKKIVSGYDRALILLRDESNNDEIRKGERIIKFIDSDRIKRMILSYIVDYNRNYYDRLNDDLDELSGNSINIYQSILSKYKVQIHSKYIKELLHISVNDLDSMLSYLYRLELSEGELLYILKYSNRSTIDKIKKYIEMGYLNSSFFKNNINMYSVDSGFLKLYEDSLKLLSEYGINPQLFKDNPMVLISNSELLKKNLLILDEYDCIKAIKSSNSFEFLLDEELVDKIDKIIELGFYDYLLDDISILNRDRKRLLRFDLLNMMNMPVTDKEGFMDVIDSKSFIVDDDSIEDYLLDVSKYHEDNEFFNMDNIINNRVDNIVVSINGQLISYPKIRRKIREGYSIKEAVCFGKYFSEEDYSSFINGNENIY